VGRLKPALRCRTLRRSSSESPHEKTCKHAERDKKLAFCCGIERILRHFELQSQARPATFFIELVIHPRLQIVGVHRFQIVAFSRSVRGRKRRQAARRVDGPVDEFQREAAIVSGRPRRDDEQRDDEKRPPLGVGRLPHARRIPRTARGLLQSEV